MLITSQSKDTGRSPQKTLKIVPLIICGLKQQAFRNVDYV